MYKKKNLGKKKYAGTKSTRTKKYKGKKSTRVKKYTCTKLDYKRGIWRIRIPKKKTALNAESKH